MVNDRSSRPGLLLVAELLLVAAIFYVDRPGFHLIYFSKTPYIAVLAAASFTLRRSWGSVGLVPGSRWPALLLMGVAGGVAMEALELFVTQPALNAIFHLKPDLSDFAFLKGNVKALPEALAVIWILAAFGEEFVYRAYLMNRLGDLFAPLRNPRLVDAASLVASSAVFGLAHLYQGPAGVIENAIDGAILAGLYIASGRKLIVPFLAHGIQDTTDLMLVFSGLYPGM